MMATKIGLSVFFGMGTTWGFIELARYIGVL